jgi:hypothetical protein
MKHLILLPDNTETFQKTWFSGLLCHVVWRQLSSETLVSNHHTSWCNNLKTMTSILTAMDTSNPSSEKCLLVSYMLLLLYVGVCVGAHAPSLMPVTSQTELP